MKLYALFLFNNIKLKLVEEQNKANSLDTEEDEREKQHFDFDKRVSFYTELFACLSKSPLQSLLPIAQNTQVLWPIKDEPLDFSNLSIQL